jgi:iron complex transport system substrate-binding protein
VDDYSDYPPEAALKAKLGAVAHSHNLEQVVSLHPDLVVTLVERGDLMDSLAAQGIPALKLFPNDFRGVLHSILLLGEVTATEERAKEIVERMKTQVDQIRDRVKGLRPPRVFFELDGTDPSKPFTSGPHSLIGDMIFIAGGWNIAQSVRTSSTRMSLEAIVASDPEIVILADANNPINPQSKGDVFRRPGWSGITAVREKAIYPVDNALFFRPGPRIVEGIELLTRIFHPEAFE